MAQLADSKPIDTTMEVSVKYQKNYGDPCLIPLCRKLVGSLIIYFSTTWPHVVNIVTEYMSDPKKSSFRCCLSHNFLFFLMVLPFASSDWRTLGLGLFFSFNIPIATHCYTDADCAGYLDTRCPNAGCCMFL